MGWNYQARKRTYVNGDYSETLFELVEAFPDMGTCDDGSPVHTESAVTMCADESKQDLANWLRKAADDVENFDLIDGGTHIWNADRGEYEDGDRK